MKIFTAQQIREGDAYTIAHEPVSSIDLMERAASACVDWIRNNFQETVPFYIFCGTGNNGGDGLAIARLLGEAGYQKHTFIVFSSDHFSTDCEANKHRLEHAYDAHLAAIHSEKDFPDLPTDAVVVDALFGTGLNRPLNGLAAKTVTWMNSLKNEVISIDLPSGLMADESSIKGEVVKAAHTLSFQFQKLAFLMPENAAFCGQVHILSINIHEDYIKNTTASFFITDKSDIRSIYKPRKIFSHKGTYGHALLIAGSYGKIGAAVLSAKACLRSGVGLLACHIPKCGYEILQTAVPEAMCETDNNQIYWTKEPERYEQYAAFGIGPGIGKEADTVKALEKTLSGIKKPVVLDADALNIIGEKRLLKTVLTHALLTPHPKEFERLFGKTENDFERLHLQIAKSKEYHVYIILKGHYTCISTPEGKCYFNSTGNAGMATAGSGDTLTGILTGLLAQGYNPEEAAVLGVYLHGLAGDLAAENLSQESLIASDISDYLGDAFKTL